MFEDVKQFVDELKTLDSMTMKDVKDRFQSKLSEQHKMRSQELISSFRELGYTWEDQAIIGFSILMVALGVLYTPTGSALFSGSNSPGGGTA